MGAGASSRKKKESRQAGKRLASRFASKFISTRKSPIEEKQAPPISNSTVEDKQSVPILRESKPKDKKRETSPVLRTPKSADKKRETSPVLRNSKTDGEDTQTSPVLRQREAERTLPSRKSQRMTSEAQRRTDSTTKIDLKKTVLSPKFQQIIHEAQRPVYCTTEIDLEETVISPKFQQVISEAQRRVDCPKSLQLFDEKQSDSNQSGKQRSPQEILKRNTAAGSPRSPSYRGQKLLDLLDSERSGDRPSSPRDVKIIKSLSKRMPTNINNSPRTNLTIHVAGAKNYQNSPKSQAKYSTVSPVLPKYVIRAISPAKSSTISTSTPSRYREALPTIGSKKFRGNTSPQRDPAASTSPVDESVGTTPRERLSPPPNGAMPQDLNVTHDAHLYIEANSPSKPIISSNAKLGHEVFQRLFDLDHSDAYNLIEKLGEGCVRVCVSE